MRFHDLPLASRPRERLLRNGTNSLSDAELLAAVLGVGSGGEGPLGTARELLGRFSDLRRIATAGIAELCSVPGIGLAQACRVKAALALAARLHDRPYKRGEPFSGPADVFDRIGRRLALLDREVFRAIALDVKQRVIAEAHIADGGVCTVELQPRDAFAVLVREGAVGVVFLHNHPSGDPTPSASDKILTQHLSTASALIGVAFIDHIIVAQGGWYSFAKGVYGGRARAALPPAPETGQERSVG